MKQRRFQRRRAEGDRALFAGGPRRAAAVRVGPGAARSGDRQMVDGDIAAQTRRVLDNIGALLEAGGRVFADVVRTTVFLADMNDFAAMNEVYGEYFAEPYPARATVQVARLPKDARVEIDVIADRVTRLTRLTSPTARPRPSRLCRPSRPLDVEHAVDRLAAT